MILWWHDRTAECTAVVDGTVITISSNAASGRRETPAPPIAVS